VDVPHWRAPVSLKSLFTKLFLFDEDKQRMFLVILSSQVKSGRPYQEIFKSMLKSTNRYHRSLAQSSLNPSSKFFASQYGALFPQHTAKLLTLSQKFNAVPQFIDHSINNPDKKALSLFFTVVWPNAMEIALGLIFTGIFVAMYLYNDAITASFTDISAGLTYQIGAFFVEGFPLLAFISGAGLLCYLYNLHGVGEFRGQLKRVGFYRFSDANFAIELFRVIHIMTSSGVSQGLSIKSLFSELFLIYGHTRRRQHQFAVLRAQISQGRPIHQALRSADILDQETLDLFRGLAPNESIPEVSKAANAISELLAAKTKEEIRFLGKNLTFFLLLYLCFAFIAMIELSVGGGANLFTQSTGV